MEGESAYVFNGSLTTLDIFYSFKEIKCLKAVSLKNQLSSLFLSHNSFPTTILPNICCAPKHNFNLEDMQKSLKINRAMLSADLVFS